MSSLYLFVKYILASWGAVSYATDFGQNSLNNIGELSGKLVSKGEEVENSTRESVSKEVTNSPKRFAKTYQEIGKRSKQTF